MAELITLEIESLESLPPCQPHGADCVFRLTSRRKRRPGRYTSPDRSLDRYLTTSPGFALS